MKNIAIVFCMMFLITGCQEKTISRDKALDAVRSYHENNSDFGKIKIISIAHKHGEYIVKWERKSNCESGTDYVDDHNGKITHGMHQIC